MQGKIFFVTGIDTNVGKTLSSLLLLLNLRQKGFNAGYMKPVETGVKINPDGSKSYLDGRYLKEMSCLKSSLKDITPFTFKSPLSPYAAAKMESDNNGEPICIKEILLKFYELNRVYDYMIVEGAGGMLVPLKKGHFVIDIAKYIDAGVILVTKAGLGMINHTLLNIEYAKTHGINIVGIIINNALNENDESVLSNKKTLSEYTDVPIIGDVPYIQKKNGNLKDIALLKNFALKYIDTRSILS